MEVVYLLIPLSILLVGVIVWVFFWAIRSGQFDDLEGPAHRILMDDDAPVTDIPDDGKKNGEENGEENGKSRT